MDFSELYTNSNLFSSKSSGQEYIFVAFIVVVAIIIILIAWVIYTLNKQFRGCNIASHQDIYNKRSDMPDPDPNESDDFNDQLKSLPRNFYIKTAYNACCGDNYKNTFVNICALDNCIYKGARCLDFQIYSYNNEPIIAASTVNNNYIKETYNHLPTEEVLRHIKEKCFNNMDSKDPLYLHFRIMSNNKEIYDILGEQIMHIFDNHLLNSANELSISGASFNKFINDTIINSPYFEQKVIIIVYTQNNVLVENSKLAECVNLNSGSDYFNLIRYNELLSKGESNSIQIDECKNKFVMVLPDLDTNLSNFDIILPISNGCQFIAMKFQTHDENLKSYLDYFKNDYNSYFSFKLKSEKLRLDKQNPAPIEGGVVLSEPLIDCYDLDAVTEESNYKCQKAQDLQEYIMLDNKEIVVNKLKILLKLAENAECNEKILSDGRNRIKIFYEEYNKIITYLIPSWKALNTRDKSKLYATDISFTFNPVKIINISGDTIEDIEIDTFNIWDLTKLYPDNQKITADEIKIFKQGICNLIDVKNSYGSSTLETSAEEREKEMLTYLLKKTVEDNDEASLFIVKVYKSIERYLYNKENFTFDSCP